jgi:cytochrome c oxidase assembly protein subunit 15
MPELSPQDWRLQLPEARRRRLRLWFWSIAAMTFVVVVIGGITRLTHSGLSIVEWRPLMGVIPPLTETQWTQTFDRYQQFPEYQVLRPRMSLAEFKYIFFWEYVHRLAARAIGAVFLIPFILFWRAGYFVRPLALRALALFGLGAAQGAVGWLMVKSGLVDRPSVSHYRLALHFAVAVTIFGFSVWLARELAIRSPRAESRPGDRRSIRRGLVIVGVLLASQIVWGALVAGLKAGWLFSTFPLMAGRLVPPGWLALDPVIVNFVQNAATVQWVHRLLGTALLVSAFVLVRRLGVAAPDRTTRRLGVALLQLIASQYLLGVLTLVYFVPVPLAAAHQALALAIVAVWIISVHHVENLADAPMRAAQSCSGSGERLQGFAVQQEEPVFLGKDDALFAPAAHDPDGGFDGGSGQVRELLPRQRHCDERSPVAGVSDLARELQEQPGKTRLDAAARELGEAVRELDQAMGQPQQESAHEARRALEQAEERRSLDRYAGRVFERDG